MGRGRAKAKQTKVARELKYSTGSLDPEALRRELASQGPGLSSSADDLEDEDEEWDDEEDDE
jgi:hypothetical protein